jgi:hypothetical protein
VRDWARNALFDTAYLRSAAKTALLSGEISAGAGPLGGIGQGLSGLGGGAPSSMPKGYNPMGGIAIRLARKRIQPAHIIA